MGKKRKKPALFKNITIDEQKMERCVELLTENSPSRTSSILAKEFSLCLNHCWQYIHEANNRIAKTVPNDPKGIIIEMIMDTFSVAKSNKDPKEMNNIIRTFAEVSGLMNKKVVEKNVKKESTLIGLEKLIAIKDD